MIRKQKWRVRRPLQYEATAALSDYTPIQQTLLLARGIRSNTEAVKFLNPDGSLCIEPFQLSGMERAVELIWETVQAGRKICIYADYDADGITAAALLYEFFGMQQTVVEVYFPDRFREGYGLHNDAIRQLAEGQVDLLITVDCGIRGIEQTALAKELGMKVIITDHHLPGAQAPVSDATINPNLPSDEYPFKALAGVGVAYKLVQALSSTAPGRIDPEQFLDYVALGTIADIVPLVGENRFMVQQGLQRTNESIRPGIEALINISGVPKGSVNSGSVGFRLGPRINAAGRLASARHAFDLLIERETKKAQLLAERLDRLNKERQKLTDSVVDRLKVEPPSENDKLVVSFDREYHQGVVGLAASRATDLYYRPAFVGTVGKNETRGSARSIPGFHVTQALDSIAPLLRRYGGHQSAAGFTFENSKRDAFIDSLFQVAEERIDDEMLVPVQQVDACIKLDTINEDLMSFLDRLEPFGSQNDQPVFCSEHVNVLSRRTVGADGAHLKLTLEQGGRPFDAIGFRLGGLSPELPDQVDVAFRLERNHYLGYETLQLNVVDIRAAGSLEDHKLTEWVEGN